LIRNKFKRTRPEQSYQLLSPRVSPIKGLIQIETESPRVVSRPITLAAETASF
jgi:hypothetical protein